MNKNNSGMKKLKRNFKNTLMLIKKSMAHSKGKAFRKTCVVCLYGISFKLMTDIPY